ncbi:hypothetical protein LSCM1_04442 [Leishmania martiniquensis]|uniref:Ankyrin repeat protein n=1 Tax=Leishmania martiniquensis TaxID=1580590 RepID=A0A836KI91_9TRYP|nr:hypothetical protein LSCM1_04442 [Leishmania martiniquensis]
MSGAPMSDEQRAALEQRLARLRAAQAAATANGIVGPARPPLVATNGSHHIDASAQQTEQNGPPTPNARGGSRGVAAPPPPPQMGYAYEDDNDEEDDVGCDNARQQFEDEFLRLVAQQQRQQEVNPQSSRELNAASVAQVNATRDADEGVNVVATDKSAPRTRELGDFEALRLAKMGDGVSMKDFGAACGVVWKTLSDNHGRNALHYAADAGSAALIRQVADDLHVPYVADEKQMTPLDIAVLNGHSSVESDEVYAALVAAAKASGHADGNLSPTEGGVKTRESVLKAHAPPPPKFVMTKPVSKAAEATGARTFWSCTSDSLTAASVRCMSGADMSDAERQAVSDAVCSLDQHGRLEWLLPVTRGAQAPCENWQVAVASQTDTTPATAAAKATGVVVAQVLANASLQGPAGKRVNAATVAVAAHLAVRGDNHHTGVAAALLHALRTRIEVLAGSGDTAVVFFSSGAQLSCPPASMATVKWYRRAFDAAYVYASDSAYDVFPDFYNYDEVLRADAVLKGTIPASLTQQYLADLPSWCDLEVASDEQCALVLAFMQTKAGSAESNVELACVPDDVQELRRSYIGHPDHRTYVRTGANGSVTDLVVFRVRDTRKAGSSTDIATGIFAAEVAYAVFTTLAGTAKVDHMMLLASKLLSAKVLLVPTMFGITDSDLARSNFDEIVANREYIYAVSLATRREMDGFGPIPSAKLALPVYTI